ncbi:MAG: hypothetical protein IJD96_11665 [Lachnospiraceae bacterium]|nr:hypothetical protein [Lachnospiraceae bacterium]
MKKVRRIMCVIASMMLLLGSTISVSAAEIDESEVGKTVVENEYSFDDYEYDENGNVVVRYYAYMPEGTTNVTCGYSVTCTGVSVSEYIPSYYGEATEWYPFVEIFYPNETAVGQYRFRVARYKDGVFECPLQTPEGIVKTDDESNMNNGKIIQPSVNLNHLLNTNIPIFNSLEAAENYFKNNDNSGIINKPPLILDENNTAYNSNVPTPQLAFAQDGGLRFEFTNASEEYFIEMQGRWWSVEDIDLYKDGVVWKYRYSSLLKGDLTEWVNPSEFVSAVGEHDLSEIGSSAFDNLLSQYPVESRTYTGGYNALMDYIHGYNDALTTIKMLLREKTSSYNSAEIYVRYYTVDDNGNYIYGKWCHWIGSLANAAGSSGSILDDKENVGSLGQQSQVGLTEDDRQNIELSGNSRYDVDLGEKGQTDYSGAITGGDLNDILGYFKQAISVIAGMGSMLGEFPALIGQTLSFLPPWVIMCIGAGIVLVIILRIVGR